jgi:hypothetical protein
MGIKYKPEVRDHKLAQRFQRLHPGENFSAPKPGIRTPKKLTKKEAARLAENAKSNDSASS